MGTALSPVQAIAWGHQELVPADNYMTSRHGGVAYFGFTNGVRNMFELYHDQRNTTWSYNIVNMDGVCLVEGIAPLDIVIKILNDHRVHYRLRPRRAHN